MSSVDPPVGGLTQLDDRTHRLFAGPPPVHADTLTAGKPSGQDWAGVLRPAVDPGELGRLGPYRVLGVLGRGGMGVVFLADDPGLDRRIALKTLLPGAGRDAAARFLREARAQAAIEHDHVVAVHQVGEDAGVPFLAMPLLQGRTLAADLAGGKLPPAEVVRIGAEVADGLAAAHARGLIHRDIKPGNVWLEGDRRRVKILDFGLARATSARPELPPETTPPPAGRPPGCDPLTELGVTVGTPAYMSPEQAKGRPVDHRTDLFSLGALLYHAATGVMPFTGGDSQAVMAAVSATVPPAPLTLNPTLPPGLDALIVRLLAKDPKDRPASAEAVAVELRSLDGPVRQPSRLPRRVAAVIAAVLLLASLPAAYFFPPVLDPRFGPADRLMGQTLRHGGEVMLADGRTLRGTDRPPPVGTRPTGVVLRTVPRLVWPNLFRSLAGTDSLTRVELIDCPLTDADLTTLADSPAADRLEELSLVHCPGVTDSGLAATGRLTRLRRLRLDLRVTPEVVRGLAVALPRCRIEWPGGVVEPVAE